MKILFFQNILHRELILLLFIYFCYFTSESLSSENQSVGLISHGELYDPVKYPYVVCLKMSKPQNSGICTGTLISPLFVLTAAHCTFGYQTSDIKVYNGTESPESQIRNVQSIRQHRNYKNKKIRDDICLLELQSAFDNITEFAILSGHPNEFDNDAELNCEIIGFGDTDKPDEYQEHGYMAPTRVKYGQHACKTTVGNLLVQRTWKEFLCSIPDRQMTCFGDSGGPMICNGSQYGIASHIFNYVDGSEPVCGDPNVQTRHLFIYVYKDWIHNTMNNVYDTGNLLMPQQNLLTILCIVVLHNVL